MNRLKKELKKRESTIEWPYNFFSLQNYLNCKNYVQNYEFYNINHCIADSTAFELFNLKNEINELNSQLKDIQLNLNLDKNNEGAMKEYFFNNIIKNIQIEKKNLMLKYKNLLKARYFK